MTRDARSTRAAARDRSARRAARTLSLQGMAAGSRAAHADEQSRSRRRRAAGRSRRLRRHREGGAQLGGVRRDRRARCARSRTTRRCSCRAASRSACSARTRGAPRVLIANSNLVGRWATWEYFRELERAGLIMYGQMTAGSWIYIGSQGILQGTYETFGAVARTHFGGIARRPLRAHARGSAAWAARSRSPRRCNGAAILGVEVDEARIDKRLATGYCDRKTREPRRGARAGSREATARAARRCRSASSATPREVLPELVRRGVTPDVLTDQTSAHDMLNGYVPAGMSLAEAAGAARARSRRRTSRARPRRSSRTCARCSSCSERGAVTFDYGNNIRTVAFDAGVADAFDIPGLRAGVRPPAVLRGEGAVPLGRALGRSEGHLRAPTSSCSSSFPHDEHLRRWITLARETRALPGTAGAHLLARPGRARAVRRRAQRPRGERRALGADRHRSRSSRHGQRRVAVPRDRGDEGRQRRDRRLADPQRAAQRRRAARRGCRSITAAASASATRCTRAR